MKVKRTTIIWNREKYSDIIRILNIVCRLTPEEESRLKKSCAAELLAAIPFIAHCQNAERIAVTHLSTFMADIRYSFIFDHKPGETFRDRIEPINHFPGGDVTIIEAGLILLEIIALNNYMRTFEDDLKNNVYNYCSEINCADRIKWLRCKYDQFDAEIKKQYSMIAENTVSFGWWY